MILLPVAFIMCAGAWLSYQTELKDRPWYPWAMTGLAALNGWLWAIASRGVPSPRAQYTLSIAWDTITILAYTLLPLVWFDVRLTLWSGVGVCLVVVGAGLVKWS